MLRTRCIQTPSLVAGLQRSQNNKNRRIICTATGNKGRGRRGKKNFQQEEQQQPVAQPTSQEIQVPSTASAESFLGALDKIHMLAGNDDDYSEDELGLDQIDHLEEGDSRGPGGHTIDEEDEVVSELLAAAGLSDDGLPLYYEEDTVEDEEMEVGDSEKGTGGRRSRKGRRRADDPPLRRMEIPDELLPRVAVVGRPNVGKSALFNRIVGKQVAIVYDYPGVTRDRLYTRAEWRDREFMLVDTGGLMSEAAALPKEQQVFAMQSLSAEGLPSSIERQAAAAVEEADAIILVVDGQTGSTASDEEVLTWLRKAHPGKPIALAVNKCENVAKADEQSAEFWSTGLTPIPVSAISGTGTGDLLDTIVDSLPPPADASVVSDTEHVLISLAIVGRPNVGKSSLLNAIIGEERSIVCDMAGTTRDAVDTDFEDAQGRSFKLIDTAGVRRRASVASTKDGAEPLSVERAFRAIRRAEVAVLVIDAVEGITQQDFRLAEYIAAEGRACVVVINKWDAVPDKDGATMGEFELMVRGQLRPVEWANIVFASAKTGQRVKKVLDAAVAAADEHRRRITTATLNLVIQDAIGWRSPPSNGNGKRGRVYYGTQAAIKPPTFIMFCNDPKLFGDDYKKYMERSFRENVGFPGSPLRLYWRGKPGASSE